MQRQGVPFDGTYIRAAIRTDYDQLLEQALVFEGRKHRPGSDYIDYAYIGEGDTIHFLMSAHLEGFGTRDAGRKARVKIDNLMNDFTDPVIFDFSDVSVISSSFADEVFGKLFVTVGPDKFGKLCRFINMSDAVSGLIDRAIKQRMSF